MLPLLSLPPDLGAPHTLLAPAVWGYSQGKALTPLSPVDASGSGCSPPSRQLLLQLSYQDRSID